MPNMNLHPRTPEDADAAAIERAEAAIRASSATAAGTSDPYRPVYHFAPPSGWMNDPNGLVRHGGYYHLFYQTHPYSPYNGPKHWGHARSRDLVHWEQLPIALAPVREYESAGCFSGSAVSLPDSLLVFYTGNRTEPRKQQVQCLARSRDGVRFEKLAENPILRAEPPEIDFDFRDPKVFEKDGKWFMIVGSGQHERARLPIYQANTSDLRAWSYLGCALEAEADEGTVWNCPDFFHLDAIESSVFGSGPDEGGFDVLLASPGVLRGQTTTRRSIYITGTLDTRTGRFKRRAGGDVDLGPDFYAPQTLVDAQGRIVMIGWLDMWWNPMPTQHFGWAGEMTIPRVVHAEANGHLRFEPHPALVVLRETSEPTFATNGLDIDTGGTHPIPCNPGPSYELELKISLVRAAAVALRLFVSEHSDRYVEVRIARSAARPNCFELTVDRRRAGLPDSSAHTVVVPPGDASADAPGASAGPAAGNPAESSGVSAPSRDVAGLEIRVFVDTTSIELFADGGAAVASYRVYPDLSDTGISVSASGSTAAVSSFALWRLRAAT